MRSIIVVLALAVLASGHYMTNKVKYADKDFMLKQQFVFELFQHVHQNDIFAHKYESGMKYFIHEHYDKYDKQDLVKEFVELWEHHPISDDELFTIFDEEHVVMAESLVHCFYLAKDWETFKNTVLWARFHVNKQLFVYAFSVATMARQDMDGIVLPAIYEIAPFYFFGAETIQKAQFYKMHGFHNVKKVEDVYSVVIPSNYTGKYGHVNEENLLAYYMEDVGLNSFYYYYNLDYPYWTKGDPKMPLKDDHRGMFYFFIHNQLLARYYMERLSHDLGEIPTFNYFDTMASGYHTNLRYYNGVFFPNRDNDFNFYYEENYDDINKAVAFEHRFYEAIDTNRLHKFDHTYVDLMKTNDYEHEIMAVDMLGNLMQGNEDSVYQKYYGQYDILLRDIINHGIPYGKDESMVPGSLMHYETSMRDPAFYEMYKRILKFYWQYVEHMGPYTDTELGFDGVKIDGVEMDKLVTYYDKFDSDITNVVDVETFEESKSTPFQKFGRVAHHDGNDFVIKARQYRLNHLPFNFKLNINSDKAQKAIIKVFIGPKYDAYGHMIHLDDNYENFVELDNFLVDLVSGKNVITRSTDDYSWFVKDRTTYFELYQKLMLAFNSDDHKFTLDMSEAHCGFPQRLLLPRGKKGGMPFQFFFMVAPYMEPTKPQFSGYDYTLSCGIGSGARYVDSLPFGFPFNRVVDTRYWDHDNLFFFDTMIYHKTETELNAVHHH